MSTKELVMDAVDKAYHGLPVEYHRRLGERVIAGIIENVLDMNVEETLDSITYHAEQVKQIYYDQGNVKLP